MVAVNKRLPLIGFLAAVMVVVGCGRSGPATYPVSGTVVYNGVPVHEGSIIFMPAEGRVAPDAGKIVDGHFAFEAKEGKKKVEIRAVREVGEVIREMGIKARQSYIPTRFNAEATLTAEVIPGGNDPFTFDLKGSP